MKHRLFFLCLFLMVIGGHGYAQKQGQARIDSLLMELPKAKEDSSIVRLSLMLSANYKTINPELGINYGMKGLGLAEKMNWQKAIAWAFDNSGSNYKTKSDYQKSLDYYFKALKVDVETGNKGGIESVSCNTG